MTSKQFEITQNLHIEITQNLNGRIIFLGDVHGCPDIIERTLDAYNFDPSVDQVVCVGDLIDRGPDSMKCLRYTKYPWFKSGRGNHEDALLEFTQMPSRKLETLWRKENGGEWWFSNNLTAEERFESIELCKRLPLAMTVNLTNGKRFGVVHAACPTSQWSSFINNLDDDTFSKYGLTSRHNIERGINHHVRDVDLVLVGHTPNKNMQILGNAVHLDTGLHQVKGRMLPALSDNEASQLHELLVKPQLENSAHNQNKQDDAFLTNPNYESSMGL